MNLVRVFHRGKGGRRIWFWGYHTSDGKLAYLKCACSLCGHSPISTKSVKGQPVLVWHNGKPYRRSCLRMYVLPKETGQKVGVGYRNVSGKLWRWRRR